MAALQTFKNIHSKSKNKHQTGELRATAPERAAILENMRLC